MAYVPARSTDRYLLNSLMRMQGRKYQHSQLELDDRASRGLSDLSFGLA